MFLSLIEKIGLVIKNAFSSFMGIEMFLIILLLFLFLVLNIKRNNKIVKWSFVISVIAFMAVIIVMNFDYAIYSIDYLLKAIMKYIYFPSTVVYFLIVVLSLVFILISNFSKMPYYKKVLDISFFSIIYFLFFNFITAIGQYKLDLADKVSLYSNNLVLSIVQISNLVFLIWIIVILFYNLYNYFKKKYDEKIEILE